MAERPTKSTTRKTTQPRNVPVTKAPSSPTMRVAARSQCAANPPKRMITEEQIRERAYQIYLARNGAPGDPTADWYQAERELRGESR